MKSLRMQEIRAYEKSYHRRQYQWRTPGEVVSPRLTLGANAQYDHLKVVIALHIDQGTMDVVVHGGSETLPLEREHLHPVPALRGNAKPGHMVAIGSL